MQQNQETILLSIIVPAYNIEKYVSTCLRSITDCDLQDCELIIAMGNSTDDTNRICEDFAQEKAFVRLAKQSGRGLSNARNCAMKTARGKYLVFLDGDDTVEPHRFQELIQKLRTVDTKPDVIVTDYRYYDYRFHAWRNVFQIGENTPDQHTMDFLPAMLKNRGGFWNVWRYVYRRDFLEKNNICFLEDTMSEDMDFTARVLQTDPVILFTHCPFYQYVIGRGSSLMDRPTWKRLSDTEKVIRISISRLKGSTFAHAGLICARYQYEYLLMFALIPEFEQKERDQILQIFSNWKEVLNGSEDPLVRCACRALHLFGVRTVSYALYFLKKLRHRKLERSLQHDHYTNSLPR